MSVGVHFPLPDPNAPRPELSVLVKSYNHAKYVRRSIESVLDQSFRNFEIVVTDDGSIDGTADVVASFEDPRIQLTRLPVNRGISAAMNATIARARGRYLAILNSDDWALPQRFETQVNYLNVHPHVSLVCGRILFVDEEGNQLGWPFDPAPSRFADFAPETFLRHFFFRGNCIAAPTVMVRREAYEHVGAYDLRLLAAQDLEMWVRMALAGLAFAFLPDEFTAFRHRDGALNASHEDRRDFRVREPFEVAKILGWFLTMREAQYARIFGEPAPEQRDRPLTLRVADQALRAETPAHRSFALETYYAHAQTTSDLRRLALLAGSLDTMGIMKPDETFPPDAPSGRAPDPKRRWWRR